MRRAEAVVVGLGAGGHAASVLDALLASKSSRVVGLLDADASREGAELLGVPVLGGDDLLPDLRRDGATHFFVGVGSVGDCAARRRLYELGRQHGLEALSVVHPSAVVSKSARVLGGAALLAGAIVGPGALVRGNAIVNSGAVVEHDCEIGEHAHVAPRATLGGGVRVGAGAHIGMGALVLQGLRIGEAALVAAGALVVASVADRSVVLGVPAGPVESAA